MNSNNLKALFKNNLGIIILVAVSIGYLFVNYGNFILHANSHMMSTEGDGVKNYFVYAGHVKNSENLLFFDQLNYPDKELHVYTDGSFPLTLFVRLFPQHSFVRNNAIGLFNLFYLFTAIIAVVLLYNILIKLNVNKVLAVIGAFVITFMSPTWIRLTGHYSLSMQFVIPLQIWLNFCITKANDTKYKFYLINAVCILILSLFHPYFGVICLAFTALYQLFYRLFYGNAYSWKKVLLSIASIILPIVLIQVVFSVLDPYNDRPANAFGIFEYVASFSSILYARYGEMANMYNDIFVTKKDYYEGYAFIGTFTIIIGLFYFSKTARKYIKAPKKIRLKKHMHSEVRSLFCTSIITLILAFSWFHMLFGEEFITHYFGPLKQIRALGRFAWIFYYCSTILAFFIIDRLLRYWKRHKKYWIAIPVLLLGIYLYAFEVQGVQSFTSHMITKGENVLKEDSKDEYTVEIQKSLDSLNLEEFGSVLPMPYFHVGGEYFGTPNLRNSFKCGLIFTYFSNLKNIGCSMGRTSIKSTKEHFDLIAPPYYPKPNYPKEITSKKILVIDTWEEKTESEIDLLKRSKQIYKSAKFDLYELSWQELLSTKNNVVAEYLAKRDQLQFSDFMQCTTVDQLVEFNDFDDRKSEVQFRGAGAFETTNDLNTLAEWAPGTLVTGETYEVSFWYYNNVPEAKGFVFVEEVKPDGRGIWHPGTTLPSSFYINGDWTLVNHRFKIEDGNSHFKILVNNTRVFPLTIDDLLIKTVSNDVYFPVNENLLFYNNHRVASKDIKLETIESKQKQVVYEYNFDDKNDRQWLPEREIIDIEGQHVAKIVEESDYNLNFKLIADSTALLRDARTTLKNIAWSGKIRQSKATEHCQVVLEFRKKNGEKILQNQLLNLNPDVKDWQQVNLFFKAPATIKGLNEMVVYLFNPKKESILVDDLKITMEYLVY